MKKWLICLLVVVFALSTVSVFALADGSVSLILEAESGNTDITFDSADGTAEFTLAIYLENNTGKTIGDIQFNLQLPDNANFTLSGEETTFSAPADGGSLSWTGGNYHLMGGNTGATITGKVKLATVKVTVKSAAAKADGGNYQISATGTGGTPEVVDNDYSRLTCSVTSLSVSAKHNANGNACTWGPEPVITPPTCTEDGKKVSTCTVCGQTKEEKGDDKTGHDWSSETADFTWQEDPAQAVTVTLTCKNCDATLTKTVSPNSVNTPATCTKEGGTTYTVSTDFKEESKPAGTNSKGQNTEKDTASTATFKDEKYVKTADPNGHEWNEPTVTWDQHKATATITCSNDGCEDYASPKAIDAANIVVTENIAKQATCTGDGIKEYVATITAPEGGSSTTTTTFKNTDTSTETIDKLGHDWNTPEEKWEAQSDGKYKVTAKTTCKREDCINHTTAVEQVIENVEKDETSTEPTYETAGKYVYKAQAAFEDGKGETVKFDLQNEVPFPKLEAPAPETTVESKIVPSQSQGTTEGIITDAANDVIGKALAGTTVDKSVVDANVCEAIKNAGTSAKDGSLSVSTELVVNENAEPDAGVAAGVPAGATFLDIAIQVTVSSNDKLSDAVVGYIHQVGTPIQFTVDKPKGGPIFYVARYHDGGWEKLETTVGETTLSFKSDKFSTFAVISSNDIADADITFTPQYAYTGAVIRPVVKVTVNGGATELKEGTDYELAVAGDAIQPGDYKLTIKGMGSYTGSVEKTITILTPDATPTPAATAAPTATPVPTEAPATATPAPTAAGTAAPTATKDPNAAPQTGDETPVMLYATMLTVCAAALTLALIFRRRREK